METTTDQRLAFHHHRLNPYDGMSSRWYKPEAGWVLPKVKATATPIGTHQCSRSKYQPEDDAVFCGRCHAFLCHKSEIALGIGAKFVCPSCGAMTAL